MNGLRNSIALLLFFGGSALFSGMETGTYLLNRVRVREQARRGIRCAQRLQRLLGETNRFVFALLIANNAANYLLARSMTRMYMQAGVGDPSPGGAGFLWNAELAATLTLMFPLFFFGELVPKNLFRQHADRLMTLLSGWAVWTDRLLQPITRPLSALFRRLVHHGARSGVPAGFSLSLEGVHDYIVEAEPASGPRQELVRTLTAMHHIQARDLMRPPASETVIPAGATVGEALERMSNAGVSRLLACRGSARRSIGWVVLTDLLDPQTDPESALRSYMRKPVRIPESLSLIDAIRRLKSAGALPALVTGRDGRTAGLLSLLDIAGFAVQGEGIAGDDDRGRVEVPES